MDDQEELLREQALFEEELPPGEEATQEEAVAILTRKLKACLPMSKLTQSAA